MPISALEGPTIFAFGLLVYSVNTRLVAALVSVGSQFSLKLFMFLWFTDAYVTFGKNHCQVGTINENFIQGLLL